MTFYHIDEEPQFPPVQQVVLEVRCERTITRNYTIVKYHTISSVGRILINAQKIPFPWRFGRFSACFHAKLGRPIVLEWSRRAFTRVFELRALTWAATLFRPAKYERTNSRTPMDTWNWFNSSADLYDTLVGIPVTDSFLRWINFKRKLLLFEQVIFLHEWKSSSKIFNSKFY